MYTATIKKKELINGTVTVTVLFSDGVNNVTESCIPQDLDGLKYWIKSRLATFNGASTIDTTFAVDDVVDVKEPEVAPVVETQAEIDRNQWLKDYKRWIKVKTTLVDTGIVTVAQPQVAALKTKVSTGLKAEYLDFI